MERSRSRSPQKPDRPHLHRNHSPASPLSNSYDSDSERRAKKQQLEKQYKYQEILHYQIKEKGIVKI